MMRVGLLAVLVAALLPLSRTAIASKERVCADNVRASLGALVHGNDTAAAKHFTPGLLKRHDASNLRQTWNAVLSKAGAYQGHGTPHVTVIDGRRFLFTEVNFAKARLDAINMCDAIGRLSFFEWGPASTSSTRIAAAKRVTLSNGATELPVVIPSPLGGLPATLDMPAGHGPFPAVVLVAGSGPQGEDETIGPNKPFRDIARGLAAEGVASLRYDKRTFAYRTKAALDKHLTVDDEVTNDALTALRVLGRQAHVNRHRLFVLGHSLGGMMAPRIGKRAPSLAGLILMAAPARSFWDVIAEQVREQGQRQELPQKKIASDEKAITHEQAQLAKTTPANPPKGQMLGMGQVYWMSLHEYHQTAVARSLSMPMLILQGGNDFQVSSVNDFGRWKKNLASRSNVTFHLYPGLSHIFMPEGKLGTMADYEKPGHVDSKVIADIAAWMKAQPVRDSATPLAL